MMRDDIRVTMPPLPMFFHGHAAVADLLETRLTGPGEWRLVPITANRMPAVASYLREWGGTEFKEFKLDLIRFEDGLVAEVTTFGAEFFTHFGLPEVLPEHFNDGTTHHEDRSTRYGRCR